MITTRNLDIVSQAILKTPIRDGHAARLVAISGIDSSGKGYISSRVAQALTSQSARVALIGIDGWLTLPAVRFSNSEPARHFYRNALRFDEMFSVLVDPLVRRGSIDVTADYTEETAQQYRPQRYLYCCAVSSI